MPKFETLKVLEVLQTEPITTLCAPPTLYRSLIQCENLTKFESLRLVKNSWNSRILKFSRESLMTIDELIRSSYESTNPVFANICYDFFQLLKKHWWKIGENRTIDELIRCAQFFRQITVYRSGFSHLTIFFRHCVSAGEPLNEEVIETWHDKTGLWIREGYGQTETTLIAATTKDMIIKPGSMGKAAPGTYS